MTASANPFNATRSLTFLVPDDGENYISFIVNSKNSRISKAGNTPWECVKTYDSEKDAWLFTLTSSISIFSGHVLVASVRRHNPVAYAEGVTEDFGIGSDNDRVCDFCHTKREAIQYLFINGKNVLVTIGYSCLPKFLAAQGTNAATVKATIKSAGSYLKETMTYTIEKALTKLATEDKHDTTYLIAAAIHAERTTRNFSGSAYRIMGSIVSASPSGTDPWLSDIEELLLPAAILRQWAIDEMPVTNDKTSAIRRAAVRPYNSRQSSGTLVDLAAHYRAYRNAERAAEAGLPVAGSGYVRGYAGDIGQRVKLIGCLVEGKKRTQYDSVAVTLRSPGGKKIVWYANTDKAQRLVSRLDEGTLVDFAGTVLKQKTFRDIDETIMTRGIISRQLVI